MKSFLKTFRFSRKGWLFVLLLIVGIILLPLFSILIRAFDSDASTWKLISEFYLSKYIWNSIGLVLGVSGMTILMAVVPAWLIANYNFFGRKFFRLALLLPIAFPTYIMAYTYTGIFDSTGTIQQLANILLGNDFANAIYFDFMTPFWLLLILSFCLYPYIYSACLVSFSNDSAQHLEASKILGANSISRFFKIGIPMAKPALFAGLFLVIMEVLNEYGAVQYFNFKTFTSGIFVAWENGDLTSAVRIATFLFATAIFFLFITQILIRKSKIEKTGKTPIVLEQLKKHHNVFAFLFCGLLFLFAFLIPFMQLLFWAIATYKEVVTFDFYLVTWNTFIISMVTAIIITLISFILLFAGNQLRNIGGKQLASLGILGYSIPGAIIAVGIIMPFAFIDNSLQTDWLLGSIFGLTIAYLIRFMAVSYNTLDGALKKQGSRLDEAALNLNTKPIVALFKIHFPVLRPALFIAIILVFVDIMKELPITLILRPMNYETLATEAYRYAQTNESAMQAAPASILLILLGTIPVILLHKLIKN